MKAPGDYQGWKSAATWPHKREPGFEWWRKKVRFLREKKIVAKIFFFFLFLLKVKMRWWKNISYIYITIEADFLILPFFSSSSFCNRRKWRKKKWISSDFSPVVVIAVASWKWSFEREKENHHISPSHIIIPFSSSSYFHPKNLSSSSSSEAEKEFSFLYRIYRVRLCDVFTYLKQEGKAAVTCSVKEATLSDCWGQSSGLRLKRPPRTSQNWSL